MRASVYHVTVLSNLVRGYDKYSRIYDKSRIPKSTFPDRFFLLSQNEIQIGIAKASLLLRRLDLPGDRLLVIETAARSSDLLPNAGTGLGRFLPQSYIRVAALHLLTDSAEFMSISIEEAYALSLKSHLNGTGTYGQLAPRSVSILPIANACQASCPFCFSKASVSEDLRAKPIQWDRVKEILTHARSRGATRAVITGGGEPTLAKPNDLLELVGQSAAVFPKVVLITNGYKYGHMTEQDRRAAIRALDDSGLSVLAVSRHYFDPERNEALMHAPTKSENLAQTWMAVRPSLRQLKMRWICVLQRGGVENDESLQQYVDWAAATGVDEICFKELYVSSSIESEYHSRSANEWSAQNQVPLSIVVEYCRNAGWELASTLPWGAPVYQSIHKGRLMRIAAYTEPSVFWELSNGMCRSWNLMADGRCLASLEDRNSEVLSSGLRTLQTIS